MFDGVHLADVGDRVNAEQEHIQDGKQDRHDAESDRDRRDDREGGQRGAPERAQREPNVMDGVVDERGAALVAAFVGNERCRPETRPRLCPCLIRRHALTDPLPGFALDLKPELVVQTRLDPAGGDYGANAEFQVAQVHWVYAGSMTSADSGCRVMMSAVDTIVP